MKRITCHHCRAVNLVPDHSNQQTYACHHCGQPVGDGDASRIAIVAGGAALVGSTFGVPGALIGALIGFWAATKKPDGG